MTSISFVSFDLASLETRLLAELKNGFRPTLAVVFCSPQLPFTDIGELFDRYNIDLLGCTTAGEIVDGDLHEAALSCLLMDVKKSNYSLIFTENKEGVFEMGQQLRREADAIFQNPAIIVATAGVLNDGEEIVRGLKSAAIPREIPLFGGLAGDDLSITNTYIFSRNNITHNGMLAIVFDNDKVDIKGIATSGWQALGTSHTVTKADGNIIYTINNEPALDFFIRFFGFHDNANVKGKQISTISAQYPLQVMRGNDDYAVLRSPLKGDDLTGSLTLVGSIREGDRFRFSISPGIEVIDQTIAEFKDFSQDTMDADALILFSCKGRHAALGPFMDDEIQGIHAHWQKPMVGFLTYGEIGNVKNGICEFHNETCSLLVIKEKSDEL
jgi:hypothetical protein